MKIAAVVILFNPTESIVANIKSYYDYLETIFVFDNTENKALAEGSLSNLPKVKYYHDYTNKGISERLNIACELAMKDNFEWILTMDQDTSFTENTLSDYLSCFSQYSDKSNVAAFGPKYNREINQGLVDCQAEEVDGLITSGMLLNLNVTKKLGGFDESLFIDWVDHDYSIRAKMAGYSIIQFSNICVLHELGKLVYKSSIKTLFVFKRKKIVHTPIRCYYIYRNLLYLESKFKQTDQHYFEYLKKHALARIRTSAFYGGNALKVIYYLIIAKNDFKNNRMGKLKKEMAI